MTCTPLALGNRRNCLHNQLQRQQDQPEANTDAAKLPGTALLTAEEENDADKNQQRRQPGEIEGQDTCHQRGTDVGAKDNHQRRGERHQILRHERGDEHSGGVAALHQRRDANTRTEGERLLLNTAAENGT